MEVGLLRSAVLFYLLAAIGFGWYLATAREPARRAAPITLAVAFLAHGMSIAARSLALGSVAVTTESEALSFFTWLVVALYLATQLRSRLPAVGMVIAPFAALATLGALVMDSGLRDLPPNLRSAWLPVHVTLAFLGNAVLALAFSVSLVYLVHERQLKEKRVGRGLWRLPSLETLDQLNYRALIFGFPLLTLGIVTGALWSKHSWGRFWSWEEREVFSAIVWLLYAGLLQARMVAGWRGRRAAQVTIVGFALMLVSFVFGHMLFPGKHGGRFD